MNGVRRNVWVALVPAVAIFTSAAALAYQGESIVKNADGDYTITYKSSDENTTELMTTVFVPATKIAPSIRSSFRVGEHGTITYRYAVSNGTAAKQSIVGLLLEQVVNPIVGEQSLPSPSSPIADLMAFSAANSSATPAPPDWEGDITRSMSRIDWMPKSGTLKTGGIKPGGNLSGFGFSSPDLPGVSVAKLDGLGAIFGYPDEGPIEDSAVIDELNRLQKNDFVSLPAAVPMIAVPKPFNGGTLLSSIQAQAHTWIAPGWLDATFSSQLDRYFQAAIDAYSHAQPKAAREHIETLRKMLKQEHGDLEQENERAGERDQDGVAKHAQISRLAAQVLDFDLRYVLRRTEEGKDRD